MRCRRYGRSIAASTEQVVVPPWWANAHAASVLRSPRPLVPVIGAGVSQAAGLPGSADLARWLADRVPLQDEVPDGHLIAVIDAVDRSKTPTSKVRELVDEFIGGHALEPIPLTDALVRVPSRFLITLNYDLLLERSAERRDIPCESLGPPDLGRAVEILRSLSWPPERLTILHLHGRQGHADELVLDERSYAELAQGGDFQRSMTFLSLQKTLVFLGTTLDELHLLSALGGHSQPGPHVLLCPEWEHAELTQGRTPITRGRYGIDVVPYPEHTALLSFAEALAAATLPPPASDGPASIPDQLSTHLYVSAAVRPYDPDAPDATDAYLGAAEAPPLSHLDVACGHRSVVRGLPGSGKTELLRAVARTANPDRPALLLRMADLPRTGGHASRVLESWATRARSPWGALPVDSDSLASRRYHFLLDGLDEVPVASQADAARLVGEVAAAHPQHDFTVSSRPVEAVTMLVGTEGGDSWRLLEMAPGQAWQQAYLRAREVSLDELHDAMPALGDLGELLLVPFFLTRLVDLYEEGRLAGLRDLGDVMRELVSASLEREDQKLLLDQEAARKWLRSIALSMALAGRTTLDAQELQHFELPGDIVGGAAALVEQLVQRLLLAEDDGNWRFAHRMVGESLAAEALELHEPKGALLDAIVPRATPDLAGVRPDLVVPVTFAALHSDAWRRAVAERDPLAAARATPSTAPLATRRLAAQRLWCTYAGWGIWMWDRQHADLLQDAEVLGRLLRTRDMHDMVDEVRRGLHGDPQQQGNAIRVLSRVRPPWLKDDLARVLGDDAHEPVVRRQAAIAAREAGLHELLDAVIARAVQPADDAERQDCTLVAVHMARNHDERIDVVRRLMNNRKAGSMALFVARERLSPAQRLRLLRTIADDHDELSVHRDTLEQAIADLPEKSGQAVVDAAYVAARRHRDSKAMIELARRRPGPAAQGLAEAINADPDVHWTDITGLLMAISPELLERVGVPPEMIAIRQGLADRARRPEPVSRQSPSRSARRRIDPPGGQDGPWTLPALLAQPRDTHDGAVAHHANAYASQVADLTPAETADLAARLEDWWPQRRFDQTITRQSRSSWSIERGAHAWLWYGPALEKPLTTSRWAEIATCGVLWSEQLEWLKRHATIEAMVAAGRLCQSPYARVWLQLLRACPYRPPDATLDAMCKHVRDAEDQEIREIGELLIARGAQEHVRRVAAVDDAFNSELRPLFAAAGDLEAQHQELRDLTDAIVADLSVDRHDVAWLTAAPQPDLLPGLFEALRLTKDSKSASGPRSGRGVVDVTNALLSAIATIGGERAVRLYDVLLEESPHWRWLRHQRDEILGDMLRSAAAATHEAAATQVGLLRLR